MLPRSIIIDTDPGVDDAVAILLALASPEFDLLGLTTVAGNVGIAKTTENALRISGLGGRPDLAVRAGCDRPLLMPLETAEVPHGANGLGDVEVPPTGRTAGTQHAVDWLIDTIKAKPAQAVTLCPIGPLTNIALMLRRAPELAEHIREIVLMGGASTFGGNVTPVAEYNIYADPHAAEIVFGSGIPMVVVPLDCTHAALMPPTFFQGLRGLGSPLGDLLPAMLSRYQNYDVETRETTGGPLHDAHVIAYLLKPDLYTGRDCAVAIETSSPLTRGMTIVDWLGKTGKPKNAKVLTAVDADGFFQLVLDRLGRLSNGN